MKFEVNARVRFLKTGSAEIDGKTGTVLYSPMFSDDNHIVLLDKPVRGQKACSISPVCLEPANEPEGSESGNVVIPLEEYNELLERDLFLYCLEGAGVDSWEGINFAQEDFAAAMKEIDKKNLTPAESGV